MRTETLSLFMCGLIDVPKSGRDCSVTDPNICIECPIRGAYITGESSDESGGLGPVLCILLWVITTIVGLIGTFTNALIIIIFKRRKKAKSFYFLLMVLASFDLFSSVLSVIAATAPVAYYEKWGGRGSDKLYWYHYSCAAVLFGRSVSIFTTILITIERYLVIAYPLRSRSWFTGRSTKLLSLGAFLISTILSAPRFFNVYVTRNPYRDIKSLSGLSHIYKSTRINEFSYHILGSAHNLIDHWMPLPLLLIFNWLAFREVQKSEQRRKELNIEETKDIQAVRMFLPVVVLLSVFNLEPIIHYGLIQFHGIAYRETYMLVLLFIALNSAVNFQIYYFRGSTFKKEVQQIVAQITKWKKQSAGESESQIVQKKDYNEL